MSLNANKFNKLETLIGNYRDTLVDWHKANDEARQASPAPNMSTHFQRIQRERVLKIQLHTIEMLAHSELNRLLTASA